MLFFQSFMLVPYNPLINGTCTLFHEDEFTMSTKQPLMVR